MKKTQTKLNLLNKKVILLVLLVILLVIVGFGFVNGSISGNTIKYVCGAEGCKEIVEYDSTGIVSDSDIEPEDLEEGACGKSCLVEREVDKLGIDKNDICKEWNDCKTNYNIDEFIKGKIFYSGIQKRNCYFKGRNFIEMKKCIIKEPVTLEKEDNKVKVLDSDNVLISEVRLVNEKITRLIIDFF
ncbi:MAG: hypothetical protein ABIH37_02805 [archaeon]